MLALPVGRRYCRPCSCMRRGPAWLSPDPSFGFRACDPSSVASRDSLSVRLLALVDVDVLGVDHIAGFLAAFGAAALRTRRRACACRAGLRTASRRLLVEFLGHFL